MPVVIPPEGEPPASPPSSPVRPPSEQTAQDKPELGPRRGIFPPSPPPPPPPPSPSSSRPNGLPADILQSISVAGVGSLAMQPSVLASLQLSNLIQNTNQSQQNAVSFQQTLNGVQVTVLGKVVNMLTAVGPLEAASVSMLFSGNAVASQLAALRGVLRGRRR